MPRHWLAIWVWFSDGYRVREIRLKAVFTKLIQSQEHGAHETHGYLYRVPIPILPIRLHSDHVATTTTVILVENRIKGILQLQYSILYSKRVQSGTWGAEGSPRDWVVRGLASMEKVVIHFWPGSDFINFYARGTLGVCAINIYNLIQRKTPCILPSQP